MCGITGFISSEYNQQHLKKMTDAIRHRGPDADGYFFDESCRIGLGHRRLSIIDLSVAGNQPMVSHCGRYTMVYNGEVYNYKTISQQLTRNWKTKSDTEVILEAFVEYGADFVYQLNGMFAIGIWDKQKKCLHLFRDRFGIKPLLYYLNKDNFAFASELKALLTLGIKKELNKEAVKDYLFLEYVPGEHTIFKNCFKLPPGHHLKIDFQGKIEISQYYNLLSKWKGNYSITEQQALTGLKQKLEASIEYRKMSDVPIGSFLSGGTDSSLICAVFQEINNTPIETFNIGFDVADYDESIYATNVAKHLNTNHHYQLVTDKEARKDIERIVDSYDEPFAVPSVIPTTILAQKTRRNVTVALSGDGGDELFMGYGYYNWQSRIEKLRKVGGKTSIKLASTLLKMINNKGKRAARVMDIPDFSKSWLHIWSQEQYMFTEKEISKLFAESYTHSSTSKNWEQINKMPIHAYEKISLFDIQNYLANDLLYKVDIASMSSSLELRVPFLDHNLVEYAINLPMELKVKHREQKYLLKKMLNNYLPKEMVYRQKWGFPAPVGNWLLNDLSYLIDEYLNKKVIEQIGLFNFDMVKKLVHEFRKGSGYHFKRVWALIVFNMWYKKWMT